jgi:hypothetical protein
MPNGVGREKRPVVNGNRPGGRNIRGRREACTLHLLRLLRLLRLVAGLFIRHHAVARGLEWISFVPVGPAVTRGEVATHAVERSEILDDPLVVPAVVNFVAGLVIALGILRGRSLARRGTAFDQVIATLGVQRRNARSCSRP